MSSLRLLRTLVTERLAAAAEEIFGLVERVMAEHEEELNRKYGPVQTKRNPARDAPQSPADSDVEQLEEVHVIKQEEEETWIAPLDAELDAELDARDIKTEELNVGPEEALKVEWEDEDVWPSTSCERMDAPPPAPPPPPPPPPRLLPDLPAFAQSDDAVGASRCCKVCKMIFRYSRTLMNHAKLHGDDELCLCGVCGELQPDKHNLLLHLDKHIKSHVCRFCSKSFRRLVELKVHTRSHTGEKPFSCSVCEKGFSRKGNMEIHMRTHTGEKPYRCGVCGKGFKITSAMVRHSRTHSGEKPYSCRVCFKGFASSSDMKIHLRTHTGEKPYACPVCGKSFPLSTPLKYHMRHHTEERPFCCSHCNRCFSDVYTLRRHMKIHCQMTQPDSSGYDQQD